MRPVIEVIQHTILPLKERYDWGPSIPYHLTGQLNRHPRSAMSFREGANRDDYLAFLRPDHGGTLIRSRPRRALFPLSVFRREKWEEGGRR